MTTKSLIIVLFASLFTVSCSKDDSVSEKVDVYSFEYSRTTNSFISNDVSTSLIGIQTKTGMEQRLDDYGYVDEQNRCDIFVQPSSDAIEINIDFFSYTPYDDRPRFVYSTFTGNIDLINNPSELPQNLPVNLEYQFDYSDKSICYIFYPVTEYTTPYIEDDGYIYDYSQYNGKYKIGKPQFLLQLSEVKKYDYPYGSTIFKYTDFKFRTKYFDYK
ncbi:MAG: hypothetical protein WAO52_08825 [Prolixibacteraceae bacterium]